MPKGSPCAEPPAIKSAPGAQYSDAARKAHLEGKVGLSVLIGADGKPKEIQVVQSLGQGLDENAVDAVRKWTFKPATYQGSPVPVRIDVTVIFKLATSSSAPTTTEECQTAMPDMKLQLRVNDHDLRNDFALARCNAMLHDDKEAVELLQLVVDYGRSYNTETWASLSNNAAWTLADNNIGLDKALKWATNAANIQSDVIRNKGGDYLDGRHIAESRRMITFWDTLGWVYFVRGDYENAAKYLAAGWPIWQDPYLGNHLAQAYEKLGRKDEAERTLAMAAAAESALSDMDMKYYSVLTDLMKKWVAAENVNSVLAKGSVDLKQFQTMTIPNPSRLMGRGDFLIAQSREKVMQAKQLSGDQSLQPMTAVLQGVAVHLELPNGEDLVFTRRGTMHCDAETPNCEIVFMSPLEALKRGHN